MSLKLRHFMSVVEGGWQANVAVLIASLRLTDWKVIRDYK